MHEIEEEISLPGDTGDQGLHNSDPRFEEEGSITPALSGGHLGHLVEKQAVDDAGATGDREGEKKRADMAEARGIAIAPRKFRGGVEENVEEYLTQFERVARANGWDDTKKKVILPCYLDGAALKWFENVEGTQGDGAEVTWAQIKEGMRETFQGIAWEEQVEYRLRMRMQEEAEPVEAYVQDVLNLCQKVNAHMDERSKIKYVLRGLKPSLLEKVMVMTNDTLANVMLNIRKVETARFMAGQRVDHIMTEPIRSPQAGAVATPSTQNAAFSSLESKLENLTSEFSKLGMRLLEQQKQRSQQYPLGDTSQPIRGGSAPRGSSRGNSYSGWYRGRGRGGYREGGRGRTSDGRVICYKCNRPGHYAIACRSDPGNEEGGR